VGIARRAARGRSSWWLFAASIGVSILVLAAAAHAQTIRGTLTGTVTDPNGAVIQGASVTATNNATNVSTTTKTNQEGGYTFTALPPGEYSVAVEHSGFKRNVQTGVVLKIAEATRLDVPLEVGAVTEEVRVVTEAPLVKSTSSELGQVIDYKQIQSLPLNGRLFQQLITLTPGALPRGFADFAENPAAAGARSFVHHSVNGLPWSGNNYLLDGVANNEPLNAFINVTPPLEAIQEFKVQTNNPTAEFGVFGGAVVNLSIRSGTNQYSGSVFEYFRNDALNARNFFAATKAPFESNQFGGTFGGPVLKNRAFFFGDYQGLRQDQGRTVIATVPTAEMRTGNLGAISAQIFDPSNGQPFAGNIIPSTRINGITRQVADIYPLPNRAGLADNYIENNVIAQEQDSFDLRGDLHLDQWGALFGRYSRAARDFVEPPTANIFMSGGNRSESANYNAVVGHTYTVSPTRLNEFRFGVNKYDLAQFGSDFGIPKNNELGIPNGNVEGHPYTFGIADFNVSGFLRTASPGFSNSVRIGTTYQLSDSFSWLLSKHSIKFGGDYRHITSTLTNPQTQPRGLFTFDRNYTSNAGATNTGHPWASFLLGLPNRVQRDFVDTRPEVLIHFVGFFVQDDFRVTRNVTVNLGLRWDLLTSPIDKNNRQTNFSLDDGLIHLASDDDRGPLTTNFYGGWAPRLGVAYSPDDGRTAFRGAYGISYYRDNFGANGGTLERNHPLFQQIDLQTPNQFVPFRSVSDGLPGFTPIPLTATMVPPPGFAVFFFPAGDKPNMSHMFNVGIQRQLPWSSVLDVAYVGTRGKNIFVSRNINVPLPGAGDLNPRRPYFDLVPNIPVINQRSGDAESWYNGLQVKLDKRFSDGLQALVSYTYSRSEDTAFILHPAFETRAPSIGKAIDIPHNFVLSWSYELPMGPGKRFWSGGGAVVQKLLEGWAVNGITSFQTGEPLNIQVATSQLNTGTGNFADVTCSDVDIPGRVEQWFDTACFANPAIFQFGNYQIGDVRGPTFFNTDFSVFKRTGLGGTRSFEFRIEMFNLFNRAHFSNPNTQFGNAQFGRISSTRFPSREIQLGARLLF
jgi:Carboxypeptidase regulatory-like domain/TonB dependent receptor-like, beta-barrel